MTVFADIAAAEAALADPATTAQDLMAIAQTYPTLWAGIARHPNAYPGLLGWLEQVGDDDVRQAISSRGSGAGPFPPLGAEPAVVTSVAVPSAGPVNAPPAPVGIGPTATPTAAAIAGDTGSFGWAVLGFFVPVVGLILWLVWMRTRPRNAKMSRNGFIIGLAFAVVATVTIVAIVVHAAQQIADEPYRPIAYPTATANGEPASVPASPGGICNAPGGCFAGTQVSGDTFSLTDGSSITINWSDTTWSDEDGNSGTFVKHSDDVVDLTSDQTGNDWGPRCLIGASGQPITLTTSDLDGEYHNNSSGAAWRITLSGTSFSEDDSFSWGKEQSRGTYQIISNDCITVQGTTQRQDNGSSQWTTVESFQSGPDYFVGQQDGSLYLNWSTPSFKLSKQTAAGSSYVRYVDPRFGFGVDVPASLSPQDGDSARWTSADQTISVVAYGNNNTSGDTISGEFAAAKQDAISRGGRVTYSKQTSKGYVVSGYDANGQIFYDAAWVGSGSENYLSWVYDADKADQVDAWVTHSYKSFTSGDLSRSH